MRILLLTPQLPYPLHQGTAIRNYGLIKGLSKRHKLFLLSFLEPGQSLEDAGPLLDVCQRVETVPAPSPRGLGRRAWDTLTHPLPDMGLRLASSAFAERLVAWLAEESFDVIQVEGIEMAPYLEILLQDRSFFPSTLIVFDDHNCEYMLQRRYAQIDAHIPRRWIGALYSFVQWQKLRTYEARICRLAHRVLAVSHTDAQALQALVSDLDVTVVPNGIDMAAYRTASSSEEPLTLVFTGKMDFRPNVDAVTWFVDEIWPRVRSVVPEAHFYIVGQRPHPQLDRLRQDPSLTLTGWVDDVRPYIARAALYVAPLRMGSGTRLKLLEAMAMGKAIVSTQLGAEGLAGEDLQSQALALVADNDAAAFAEAVSALLRDPARRQSMQAAARSFVQAHYDWEIIIPRLEALYARSVPR